MGPEETMRFVARLAEPVEAAAWADFCANAPSRVAAEAGVRMERLGPAIASMAWRYDVLAINRVFGLGVLEPASEDDLDRLLSIYEPNPPARLAVQIVPSAEPSDTDRWLVRRGFRPLNNWVRLFARSDALPGVSTRPEIRIETVEAEGAESFGRICAEAFGWPELFGPWAGASVGRPGWHHLMAFDGETPIATGALFVRDDVGWLGMAATRASDRRRGAQTALLLERFRRARASGCEWLVVETAEDRPDRPAQSWRNLTRMGFQTAYLRPNWVRPRNGATSANGGALPRPS